MSRACCNCGLPCTLAALRLRLCKARWKRTSSWPPSCILQEIKKSKEFEVRKILRRIKQAKEGEAKGERPLKLWYVAALKV